MISPLDAFSALTQMQAPLNAGASLPTGANLPAGATQPVSEGFSVPQLDASPVTVSPVTTSGVSPVQGPTTWGHMVQQMVMDVNAKQQNATSMVTDVLKGGNTPVHDAMIATEEASLSFELVAEMRNKIVDAYNQVMQMQV